VLGFFAAVLWVAFIIFLSFIEIEGGSNTSNAFIDALINYGWMILIVFVMIGYSIMLLIWRIKVTSKRLVVRNFFGIEKSYPIDQITHTRKGVGKILLHMGEKRIAKVELLYTNADSLLILFETAVKEEGSEYSMSGGD